MPEKTVFRIALANLRLPSSPQESVHLSERAIEQASAEGAGIVCFPECYVPGYRASGKQVAPMDTAFLEDAKRAVQLAARRSSICVIMGTVRITAVGQHITATVIGTDGATLGYQDKVQLDPSEDEMFVPGSGRRVFETGGVTFGVSICHEGWRYPETVRWAVREGAQIVFHPHFGEAEPGGFLPTRFGDPENSFHEKAALCRAAENTCYFATVNCASAGSPTTSAVASPDGTLLCYQQYGEEGILLADLDISLATGLLARRYKPLQE